MSATYLLLEDLQKLLTDAFRSHPLRYRSEQEVYIIPPINIGHLPPKRPNDTAGDPPFVNIKTIDGELDSNQRDILVRFLCCVYSKESETEISAGYNDILNMVDTICFTLLDNHYYANHHWFITGKIKWNSGLQKEIGIYEGGMQDHPFYGAVVSATFTANSPQKPILTEITR
jgi:hypothetical protein